MADQGFIVEPGDDRIALRVHSAAISPARPHPFGRANFTWRQQMGSDTIGRERGSL